MERETTWEELSCDGSEKRTIRRRRENRNDGGGEWSMVRERVGEVDIMMDIRLLE